MEIDTDRIKNIVFAAAVYLALGALGLSFAVAPSYASPVFPAAGFAVAFLLWSGWRSWPAIWLGSLLLNLGAGWMHGDLDWRSVALAAGIAISTTLQAIVTRWLVLRAVKDGWQTLEDERDIFLTLMVAGPVGCMVACSMAVPQLYWAQVSPDANYLRLWWNWWSGDVLGVLMVLPLTLALQFRKHPLWHRRWVTLLPPMLVAVSLVGSAMLLFARWELAEDKLIVARHGEELAELLGKRVTAHQEAIAALRRLLEVTPNMNYAQFEHFTRITLADNRDIFALSINPYVIAPQRQAFEHAMSQRSAISGFVIKERDDQLRLTRAKERSDYVPVGLIAPLEGNRGAIGFDINSDGTRHDAIERAKQTAAPAVTGAIQLVQDNQKRVGVLVLHPAFERKSNPAAPGSTLMGFAVGVIKVDQMVQIATATATAPGMAFRLDDMQAAPGQSLLYSSQAVPSLPNGDSLWQQDVRMADRSWRLSVFPTLQFQRQRTYWTTALVGVVGLGFAALLQMLLLVTTGKTAIVQRKVLEQTAMLRAASYALEDQNAQLNALFRLSPDGFVGLAADGYVKFVNPAFVTMTGIDSRDIVGFTDIVLDAELRKRCEVPAAFAGVASCFHALDAAHKQLTLELSIPSPRVLQMVGIHSASSSVARILYLRDVTHQTEVDRMKSEFLSAAAHELRTPMASIFGFAEILLAQETMDSENKELLGIIYRQSALMASILNELLDLARIEARRGKDFVFVEMSMKALVEEVVSEFKLPTGRTSPVLMDYDSPLTINADRKKMHQAILNVLSNAYKYSPEGGDVQIHLLASPHGEAVSKGRVGIRISDHGIGLTSEQMKRVFERFYRADASGKIPGTGLGMSLVQEIVELHGGTVELTSEYGVGTIVTLWLKH